MEKITHYHEDTPKELRDILESCLHRQDRRVRIFYGDTTTGRDWLEEYDVTGYIGRSTGTKPIPLIIHNRRSMGGGGLLDHCIVRLLINGREVYRHPKYTLPKFTTAPCMDEGLTTSVLADGKVCAQFTTPQGAARWIEFMQGKRLSK